MLGFGQLAQRFPGVRTMSLRSKIVVILSVVVLLYAAVDHMIQRMLVMKSFVALERASAEKDMTRVANALSGEIDHLQRDCANWATSKDTYHFVGAGNQDYVQENLLPQTFETQQITLLYVCDLRGKVVWGRIRDRETNQDIHLRDFPGQELSPAHPLMVVRDQGPEKGVMMTERGAMLVAAQAITGPDTKAAPRGTVIIGRLLDRALTRSLVEKTGVNFRLWALNDPAAPPEVIEAQEEVTASNTTVLRPLDDEHLQAYAWIPDIRNAPALIYRADLTREVTARGATAARYALVSTVAAGVLIMLVLLNLLQRTVLQPIGELTRHAVAIGRSEDTTRRINSTRGDEVGILSREFDGMIDKLAQSRADVVKAARAAGMSEIATGVLHNVGNVLNSVNVSATLARERVQKSSTKDLDKVVKVLEPHAEDLGVFFTNDKRAKHLLPLLRSIAEQLNQERQGVEHELRGLGEGIDHIKELVQAQQGYAGRAGVQERVALAQEIETALSMTGQTLSGAGPLDVVREFAELPACRVDRHRLLEILVNLIQNARQSVQEAGVQPARLTLRVHQPDAACVRIEITDNGMGIPPENIARVFTHGFTTKKTGHGFGLHASANAATEMGAKLTAHSDGPGRGATFVLELPVVVEAAAGVLV